MREESTEGLPSTTELPDPVYLGPETRRRSVLVAVVNNVRDLQRAAEEGWYRIPQRHAPRRVGADYLALYQTGAFRPHADAYSIAWYAPVRRYQLLPRRVFLPQEGDHPRAEEYYFRLELGPPIRLARPIPSATLRRLTFISTTLERLLTAQDVRQLFVPDDPFESLWNALREAGLRPLPNRFYGDTPVDITLRARSGRVGIQCRERRGLDEPGQALSTGPWALLYLAPETIAGDLTGCLRRIGSALLDLGGSA